GTVYVNEDWDLLAGGTMFNTQFGTLFKGVNAFADLASAFAAVAAAGTIFVAGSGNNGPVQHEYNTPFSFGSSDNVRLVADTDNNEPTVTLDAAVRLASDATFTLDNTYGTSNLTTTTKGTINGAFRLSVSTAAFGVGDVSVGGAIGGTKPLSSVFIGF